MQPNSLAYAKYWRTSLADADLGKGALQKSDLESLVLRPSNELEAGRLALALVEEFFKGVDANLNEVEITVRPFVFNARLDHGKKRTTGIPQVVTPIVSQAVVDRQGKIFPSDNTVIPRDILEPIDKGSFAIGSVTELDGWLADHDVPKFDKQTIGDKDPDVWHYQRWQDYLGYCHDMLKTVSKGWPDEQVSFQRDDRWIVVQNDDVKGASVHILKLYDHIKASNPTSGLFDRYASESVDPPEPCLPPNSQFAMRLGHSSETHPLADAQRDALIHQLASKHGEILGVNGPPGTGKTTMLLSVVANHWVRSAMTGGDPPLIAAASTNNQAVTNIIDAFAKDFSIGTGPFSGRWLPEIKSFGAYFPSKEKERQSTGKYQTRAFFETVEDKAYVERAKVAFLTAANSAFPNLNDPSVKDIVARLRDLIVQTSKKLTSIEAAWSPLQTKRNALHAELGDSPHATLAARRSAADSALAAWKAFRLVSDQWDEYLGNESWVYILLSWIPPVGRRRVLRAKRILKGLWPTQFPERKWSSIDEFSTEIESSINTRDTKFQQLNVVLKEGEKVFQAYNLALGEWSTATKSLGLALPPESLTLAQCDKAADTLIRFPAFLHATHYWEGRWLMEMEKVLPSQEEERKKKGAKGVQERWRRRMMLTPCVVSTFFMLPSEFEVRRYDRGSQVPDYLYDTIDLLIVDEAGQVLPEVAGASFSLAKKALVIGDTQQLEPIWKMTSQVDIGNMLTCGVMDGKDVQATYNRIGDIGKSSASGSVMEVAQHATRYHYDEELARGMYLYEHRRCFNEIVEYCNKLCYHGKLLPMRSPEGVSEIFPAMGYLHIDGKCERSGGSRANVLEAEVIADWIVQNRSKLERRYNKPVCEIVGVVTPFGGQVAQITDACEARGIAVGKGEGQMTVGTVHSLQGAERIVVIFSPTYSRDADGKFMDARRSMLNVGVSRAKDSFLVFGDMSVFKTSSAGTPRGLLATFLFKSKDNEMRFQTEAEPSISHGV